MSIGHPSSAAQQTGTRAGLGNSRGQLFPGGLACTGAQDDEIRRQIGKIVSLVSLRVQRRSIKEKDHHEVSESRSDRYSWSATIASEYICKGFYCYARVYTH
jgi:hypothetical protein